MSNSKRNQLLSDEEISGMAQLAVTKCQPDANPMFMYMLAAGDMRDRYEHLVTEGKLRVVEEVEAGDDGNCSGCGKWVGYPDGIIAAMNGELPKHCKNCGQPIKRA